MDYQEALFWIHSIGGKFGINQGLERIELLLHYLGSPHKKLKYLHIGGTNGKGSTAAFAASVLEAAGYRVGLYTSPYLEQFTDRMAINGKDVSEERLAALVERVKPLAEKVAAESPYGHPTEFEVVTALAFCYFAEESPDIVVLEVGLGGRLDATNVVEPLVTVLTTISLEHTQILGDTIEAIAREKAGIIKAGSPVVTQARGSALDVFRSTCREKHVPLFVLGEDFRVEKISSNLEGQTFHYRGLQHNFSHLQIRLLGDHQLSNAATALAALELLEEKGFFLPEEAFRRGLNAARWPGRLEVMRRSPLVVVDGAHNLEAFQSLRQTLKSTFFYRRLILVLGLLGDKAKEEILKEILPLADILIVARPNSPRAADPRELAALAQKMFSLPVYVEEEISEAVKTALSLAKAPDLVLVAGSLYLISDARQVLKGPDRTLA